MSPIRFLRFWIFTCVLFMVSLGLAQETTSCPALVEQALARMNSNCEGTGLNSACYGYDRVFSVFTEVQPEGFFSQPTDRTQLITLSSIQTTALDATLQQWGIAVLNLQADVPNTLAGQGVLFLLLGDVTLENQVAPEDAFQPVDGVPVITRSVANLHSFPGLNSNLIALVDANTELIADGVSQDGSWLRVAYQNMPAWVVLSALESVARLSELPVLSPERQMAMQAFRFSTGIGTPQCGEAESALVVKGPENLSVSLTINGVDIRLASLVTLQSLPEDQFRLTVNEGVVETAQGQMIREGETIIARIDADTLTVLEWAPPRPATPEELATANRVRDVIQNLVESNAIVQEVADWVIGQRLEVNNPDGAWQRQRPASESAEIVTVLPDRTPVIVAGGPANDGLQWWWEVSTEDRRSTGWVEQSQLREPVAVPIACTPRSDWAATYVVQPGDTLFRLAQSFGLSLAELQVGNCIPDAGDIDAGQVLRVPFSRPSAPSESSAPPTEPPAPGQPPPPTATSAPPTAPPTDTSTPSPTKFVPPTKPPTK